MSYRLRELHDAPTSSSPETLALGNSFYGLPPAVVGEPSSDPSSLNYYEALSERCERLFGGLCLDPLF